MRSYKEKGVPVLHRANSKNEAVVVIVAILCTDIFYYSHWISSTPKFSKIIFLESTILLEEFISKNYSQSNFFCISKQRSNILYQIFNESSLWYNMIISTYETVKHSARYISFDGALNYWGRTTGKLDYRMNSGFRIGYLVLQAKIGSSCSIKHGITISYYVLLECRELVLLIDELRICITSVIMKIQWDILYCNGIW